MRRLCRALHTPGWPILLSAVVGLLVTTASFTCITESNTSKALASEPAFPPDTQPSRLAPGQKVFSYCNPVYQGSFPDPGLLRVGEYFYAAATGERIMRSRDLVNWETVGTLFAAGKPAWVDHASPDIWAPDLNYIDGKYVAYFTARSGGYADIHRGIGVAWADKPEGPYQAADKPLAVGESFRNIDPMAFLDDDGRRYLYWGSAKEPILVQELSADGLSLIGTPRIALHPDPYIRYSRLVEGTWVIKRGDYYYIFWSGDGYHPGNYAVSVARSTSPFGPFERYDDNPIIKDNLWWTSPGHNALIQDDAGQDWLVYHAYDTSDTELGRMLLIDKLVWKNGWPTIDKRAASSVPVKDGPIWNTTAIPLVEVAFGKPCVASSEQERKEAVKALDGNTYSGWLPVEDDPLGSLTIDLGEERRIARVDLRFKRPANGDMGYLVEISSNGVDWRNYADRTQANATYPYSESNEADGRYIRVSRIVAPASGNPTLYEVRVFAYQGVWMAGPDTLAPASGHVLVNPHIANDLGANRVSITLDGELIYDGVRAPDPALALDLPDGPHQLALTVADANAAIWRHELQFQVKHSQITAPAPGATLHGVVPLELVVGYSAEKLRRVKVALIPIDYGERRDDAAQTLYSGAVVPAELLLDTYTIPDGAYDIVLSAENQTGNASTSSVRVLVKNWVVQTDEFEPPITQGWFGSVDRKKTIFESEGWGYDTNARELFDNDGDRRVWQGDGEGELIWSVPGVRRFTLTLYTRSANLSGMSVMVSADRRQWQAVKLETTTAGHDADGWRKVVVSGEAAEEGSYLRLAVPETLKADQLQLSRMEIASPTHP